MSNLIRWKVPVSQRQPPVKSSQLAGGLIVSTGPATIERQAAASAASAAVVAGQKYSLRQVAASATSDAVVAGEVVLGQEVEAMGFLLGV